MGHFSFRGFSVSCFRAKPGRWTDAVIGAVTLFYFLVPLASAQEDSFIYQEPATNPVAISQADQTLGNSYQTELPEIKEMTAPLPAPKILPEFVTQAAIVIGAIVIFVLIFNLFFSGGRYGPDQGEGDLNDKGEIDFSRLQVPDPDRLAQDGRFAEAIHALLLRSLVLISQRAQLSWPRSLTSREILGHGQLPSAARAHLGQLIHRVEVHHFGGMVPAAADFFRCQEIYEKLASELKGGSA